MAAAAADDNDDYYDAADDNDEDNEVTKVFKVVRLGVNFQINSLFGGP